jgi:hypothetical protein
MQADRPPRRGRLHQHFLQYLADHLDFVIVQLYRVRAALLTILAGEGRYCYHS